MQAYETDKQNQKPTQYKQPTPSGVTAPLVVRPVSTIGRTGEFNISDTLQPSSQKESTGTMKQLIQDQGDWNWNIHSGQSQDLSTNLCSNSSTGKLDIAFYSESPSSVDNSFLLCKQQNIVINYYELQDLFASNHLSAGSYHLRDTKTHCYLPALIAFSSRFLNKDQWLEFVAMYKDLDVCAQYASSLMTVENFPILNYEGKEGIKIIQEFIRKGYMPQYLFNEIDRAIGQSLFRIETQQMKSLYGETIHATYRMESLFGMNISFYDFFKIQQAPKISEKALYQIRTFGFDKFSYQYFGIVGGFYRRQDLPKRLQENNTTSGWSIYVVLYMLYALLLLHTGYNGGGFLTYQYDMMAISLCFIQLMLPLTVIRFIFCRKNRAPSRIHIELIGIFGFATILAFFHESQIISLERGSYLTYAMMYTWTWIIIFMRLGKKSLPLIAACVYIQYDTILEKTPSVLLHFIYVIQYHSVRFQEAQLLYQCEVDPNGPQCAEGWRHVTQFRLEMPYYHVYDFLRDNPWFLPQYEVLKKTQEEKEKYRRIRGLFSFTEVQKANKKDLHDLTHALKEANQIKFNNKYIYSSALQGLYSEHCAIQAIAAWQLHTNSDVSRYAADLINIATTIKQDPNQRQTYVDAINRYVDYLQLPKALDQGLRQGTIGRNGLEEVLQFLSVKYGAFSTLYLGNKSWDNNGFHLLERVVIDGKVVEGNKVAHLIYISDTPRLLKSPDIAKSMRDEVTILQKDMKFEVDPYKIANEVIAHRNVYPTSQTRLMYSDLAAISQNLELPFNFGVYVEGNMKGEKIIVSFDIYQNYDPKKYTLLYPRIAGVGKFVLKTLAPFQKIDKISQLSFKLRHDQPLPINVENSPVVKQQQKLDVSVPPVAVIPLGGTLDLGTNAVQAQIVQPTSPIQVQEPFMQKHTLTQSENAGDSSAEKEKSPVAYDKLQNMKRRNREFYVYQGEMVNTRLPFSGRRNDQNVGCHLYQYFNPRFKSEYQELMEKPVIEHNRVEVVSLMKSFFHSLACMDSGHSTPTLVQGQQFYFNVVLPQHLTSDVYEKVYYVSFSDEGVCSRTIRLYDNMGSYNKETRTLLTWSKQYVLQLSSLSDLKTQSSNDSLYWEIMDSYRIGPGLTMFLICYSNKDRVQGLQLNEVIQTLNPPNDVQVFEEDALDEHYDVVNGTVKYMRMTDEIKVDDENSLIKTVYNAMKYVETQVPLSFANEVDPRVLRAVGYGVIEGLRIRGGLVNFVGYLKGPKFSMILLQAFSIIELVFAYVSVYKYFETLQSQSYYPYFDASNENPLMTYFRGEAVPNSWIFYLMCCMKHQYYYEFTMKFSAMLLCIFEAVSSIYMIYCLVTGDNFQTFKALILQQLKMMVAYLLLGTLTGFFIQVAYSTVLCASFVIALQYIQLPETDFTTCSMGSNYIKSAWDKVYLKDYKIQGLSVRNSYLRSFAKSWKDVLYYLGRQQERDNLYSSNQSIRPTSGFGVKFKEHNDNLTFLHSSNQELYERSANVQPRDMSSKLDVLNMCNAEVLDNRRIHFADSNFRNSYYALIHRHAGTFLRPSKQVLQDFKVYARQYLEPLLNYRLSEKVDIHKLFNKSGPKKRKLYWAGFKKFMSRFTINSTLTQFQKVLETNNESIWTNESQPFIKPRNIQALSQEGNPIAMLVGENLLLDIKRFLGNQTHVGMTQTQVSKSLTEDLNSIQDPVILTIDVSSFDSCQSIELQQAVDVLVMKEKLMYYLSKTPIPPMLHKVCYNFLIKKTHVLSAFAFKNSVKLFGVRVKGTTKSGNCCDTTAFNTLRMHCYLKYACKLSQIPEECYKICNTGDDAIIMISRHYKQRMIDSLWNLFHQPVTKPPYVEYGLGQAVKCFEAVDPINGQLRFTYLSKNFIYLCKERQVISSRQPYRGIATGIVSDSIPRVITRKQHETGIVGQLREQFGSLSLFDGYIKQREKGGMRTPDQVTRDFFKSKFQITLHRNSMKRSIVDHFFQDAYGLRNHFLSEVWQYFLAAKNMQETFSRQPHYSQ